MTKQNTQFTLEDKRIKLKLLRFPSATEQNGGLHVMTVYDLVAISW